MKWRRNFPTAVSLGVCLFFLLWRMCLPPPHVQPALPIPGEWSWAAQLHEEHCPTGPVYRLQIGQTIELPFWLIIFVTAYLPARWLFMYPIRREARRRSVSDRTLAGRKSLASLSVLSMLLLVSTLTLWGRSYWVLDEAHVGGGFDPIVGTTSWSSPLQWDVWHKYQCVGSHQGRVYYATGGPLNYISTLAHIKHMGEPIDFSSSLNQGMLGYGPIPTPDGYGLTDCSLFFLPHWLIAVITAALPARWFILVRRRLHAARLGLCLTCGYDLRASRDRCPECGMPFLTTGQ
ncbi:MAG: hypothetical protein ACHRHE_12755 [Tepidisphaerales bacterium]